MIYTSYDASNGAIIGQINVGDKSNIPAGTSYVEGKYSAALYYIDRRQPVLYPAKPSDNTWVAYTWDLTTKTWSINNAQSATNARRIRDAKLVAVDRVNPFWYNSMSESDRAEVQAYRLALLNVPEQAGFPVDIVWPIKPSWL
jgi:hypothetical protein